MTDSIASTPIPPSATVKLEWKRDGIRAWLACFAALYAYAATWGTTGSFSMLLPRLVELFKYENASDPNTENPLVYTQTSTVSSVNNGLTYIMTLPAALLVQYIGCRLTALLGISISVLGTAASALWPRSSLWVWWLGFGVGCGSGNALIYVASSVAVEQVFAARYGTASSILTQGSSITYLLLPIIWNALLRLGADGAPDKLAGTEAGMSFVMFSICLSVLLCLPLLPLFGSPFFIAVREYKNNIKHSSSTNSSINFDNSVSKTMPENNAVLGHTANHKQSRFKRVFFYLFDFPVPGYKYSKSATGNGECIIDTRSSATSASSTGWRYQLQLVWSMVTEWNFFLFLVIYALFLLFNAGPDTYISSKAEELFPEDEEMVGSLMLHSYGFAMLFGKLLVSPLLDWFPSLFGRTMIFASGVLLKGFFSGAVPVAIRALRRLEVMLGLYASHGLWDGLHYGAYTALIQSLVGSERFGLALSLSMVTSGPPVIAGPPFMGLARDLLKEYSLMFAVSGVLITLTALPMLLFRFSRDPLWQVPPESRSSRVGQDPKKGEHRDTELHASSSPAGTRGSHPEDTSTSSAVDSSSAPAPAARSDAQHTGAEPNKEAKVFAVSIESSTI